MRLYIAQFSVSVWAGSLCDSTRADQHPAQDQHGTKCSFRAAHFAHFAHFTRANISDRGVLK